MKRDSGAKSVVAVLDFRNAKGIVNIKKLLDKSDRRGKALPRDWRRSAAQFKSLTVFDDGSCLLHTLSAQSLARKIRKGSFFRGLLP